MPELCDLSAVKMRRLIGAKTISPVELLESCLARIAAVNPRLNAFTSMATERARAEARAAEAAVLRGEPLPLLHGLPIGIKDLQETAGLRTTWGSPIFADHVPAEDEGVVASVRRAGAVVVGKTNVPEFGAGANTNNPVFGPTGNPFDPTRICGGSSGGSAVALATGMVPLATGSDTGGSVRIPAAYCGVVGFRPSATLIPSEKRALGWNPLSTFGPMARTVEDACLLLAAMAGHDPRDPLTSPVDAASFAAPPPVDLSRLRVALSEDLGFAPMDNAIRALFRRRTEAFASAFRTAERRDPSMAKANEAFEIMRAVAFLPRYRPLCDQYPDQVGPNIRANVAQGLGFSAADVGWAHAEQTRIYREFLRLFQEIDLLICPTNSVPPFPVEQLYPTHINGEPLRTYFHWLAPTYGLTLTAHPVAVIPCGLDHTGTPFGLQVCGPMGQDRFVLGAAAALEQLLAGTPELARPLPPIPG
ncbi:MAG: amidase family protein [Candidatus Methylomirabilota bacterium]